MAKLIFGCGYLGRRVATLWQGSDTVVAVTRSAERAAAWQTLGWQPFVGDVLRPESLRGLPVADTVVYAVGHDPKSGVAAVDFYLPGLRNAVTAVQQALVNARRQTLFGNHFSSAQDCVLSQHFIYISSTSVYGQSDGQWVDETTPPEPRTSTGQLLLEAESWLQTQSSDGFRVSIIRLGGLYGPDRVPYLAAVRRGEMLSVNPDSWLNLIHVEDAAHAVEALASRPDLSGLYNAVDDEPITRRQYLQLLATLARVTSLPFAPCLDILAGEHNRGNRRIRNTRLRKLLALTLTYPSCRNGLPPLVQSVL
jgi:nucleoside-diphosphate-sugar epimerase